MNKKGKSLTTKLTSVMVGLCLGLMMQPIMADSESTCWAADYPTKPVKLIVPFPAGAATDMVGRYFAERLTKKWGVPVNVVNIPGGNAMIGTSEAMLARPDGYTILMELSASSSFHAETKDLPCALDKRSFLANAVQVPQVLIVNSGAPWKSLKELADSILKDPSSMSYGTLGGKGACDIVGAQFFDVIGIDVAKIKKVSFTGSAPAITAVGGGHVNLTIASPGAVLAVVKAGRARALAVTSEKRSVLMPDVPTTSEIGYPKVNYCVWFGFSSSPGTAGNVVQTWTQTVQDLLKEPEVLNELKSKLDADPVFMPPEEFKKFVLNEATMIKRLLSNW